MKLKLNKALFLERLSFAQRFTSSKMIASNILQGVLLEKKQEKLHFYSSNLNSFFHTSLSIEGKEEGRVIVEPKKIIEFLSLLPQGDVDFVIEDGKIIVELGNSKGVFPFIKADDFPTPPPIPKEWQKLETKFLKENLPLVLFSAAGDESRPVLAGVSFITVGEETVLVATDGFRLSLIKTHKGEHSFDFLIPAAFLEELLRSVGEEKEIEFLHLKEEKLVAFRTRGTSLYTRLIEGEFPPYEKVIPVERKTRVIVEREELLRNIKIIAVFARDLSNIIVFDIQKEKLILRPKIEKKIENKTQVDVQTEGENQKIAFNYRFVTDFLMRVVSKNVIIEALRPDAPVVFKAEGKDNFIHIIMPVRIQEGGEG